MAAPTEIPGPLSDRSLAHGRNVMAAAGVILVLVYVPGIEIKKFSPLGFDFNEGGELSVWGLLAVVLVYYGIRFAADCWTDYNGWRDTYVKVLNIKDLPDITDRADRVHHRHAQRLNKKFWWFDAGPPAVMFVPAIFAAYHKIDALWN